MSINLQFGNSFYLKVSSSLSSSLQLVTLTHRNSASFTLLSSYSHVSHQPLKDLLPVDGWHDSKREGKDDL